MLQQAKVEIQSATGMSHCICRAGHSSAACMTSGNQNLKHAERGRISLCLTAVDNLAAVEFACLCTEQIVVVLLSACSPF